MFFDKSKFAAKWIVNFYKVFMDESSMKRTYHDIQMILNEFNPPILL